MRMRRMRRRSTTAIVVIDCYPQTARRVLVAEKSVPYDFVTYDFLVIDNVAESVRHFTGMLFLAGAHQARRDDHVPMVWSCYHFGLISFSRLLSHADNRRAIGTACAVQRDEGVRIGPDLMAGFRSKTCRVLWEIQRLIKSSERWLRCIRLNGSIKGGKQGRSVQVVHTASLGWRRNG
jgi:hypothetical protein